MTEDGETTQVAEAWQFSNGEITTRGTSNWGEDSCLKLICKPGGLLLEFCVFAEVAERIREPAIEFVYFPDPGEVGIPKMTARPAWSISDGYLASCSIVLPIDVVQGPDAFALNYFSVTADDAPDLSFVSPMNTQPMIDKLLDTPHCAKVLEGRTLV